MSTTPSLSMTRRSPSEYAALPRLVHQAHVQARETPEAGRFFHPRRQIGLEPFERAGGSGTGIGHRGKDGVSLGSL